MPIPEPGLYRPSNLTPEQREADLAACYGVTVEQPITHEEAQRMRQILARFESDSKPIQTIDLNNPPREQYRFQKFPMLVYANGGTLKVNSEAQLAEALEAGWSTDAAIFHDQRSDDLKPAYQMEVQQAEAKLAEAREASRRRRTTEAA
jgi:hypothetical protein